MKKPYEGIPEDLLPNYKLLVKEIEDQGVKVIVGWEPNSDFPNDDDRRLFSVTIILEDGRSGIELCRQGDVRNEQTRKTLAANIVKRAHQLMNEKGPR
jgi:hypothetical protein